MVFRGESSIRAESYFDDLYFLAKDIATTPSPSGCCTTVPHPISQFTKCFLHAQRHILGFISCALQIRFDLHIIKYHINIQAVVASSCSKHISGFRNGDAIIFPLPQTKIHKTRSITLILPSKVFKHCIETSILVSLLSHIASLIVF